MPSQPSADGRRKWLVLALLAMAQFVVVLDASIVNVALPSIGKDLNFSQENLAWVVNAYVLTFGGFLLLGGRMADLLGRRRVFIIGLIVFAAASLAGGLAESEAQLVIARAVQGLGAALLSPAALSIVTNTFAEGSERNKALGVWGAVAGSGGAAGVLLGGVLTDGLGWQWVLYVNVPIGIVAALLAPRLITESRAEGSARSTSPARSRSPPACRCSSTRSSTRTALAGARARPSASSPSPRPSTRPSWRSSCARRRRSCRSGSSATAPRPARTSSAS